MGNLYLKYRQGFPKNLDKVFIQKPDGTSITYQELENQSAAYANGFEALGLEPGDRVTVQVEKCPEAIYIYLACLRANLIFHPLNTAYKETELSFFIDDARPSLFICTSDTYQNFSNLKISNAPKHVYTLHGQKEKPIQDIRIRDDHEVTDCSKDHTAALLYSSGTTGTPKGIMLSHGNIGSNASSLVQCWGFKEKDRLLHALPIYHVHGLFVALGCVLMSGSEINWLESFDTDSVLDLLSSSTVMMGVPTYYTRLLSSDKLDKEIVKNIRLFISGSAPLLEETLMVPVILFNLEGTSGNSLIGNCKAPRSSRKARIFSKSSSTTTLLSGSCRPTNRAVACVHPIQAASNVSTGCGAESVPPIVFGISVLRK